MSIFTDCMFGREKEELSEREIKGAKREGGNRLLKSWWELNTRDFIWLPHSGSKCTAELLPRDRRTCLEFDVACLSSWWTWCIPEWSLLRVYFFLLRLSLLITVRYFWFMIFEVDTFFSLQSIASWAIQDGPMVSWITVGRSKYRLLKGPSIGRWSNGRYQARSTQDRTSRKSTESSTFFTLPFRFQFAYRTLQTYRSIPYPWWRWMVKTSWRHFWMEK